MQSVAFASAFSRNLDGMVAIQEACNGALQRSQQIEADWALVFANVHYRDEMPQMLTQCVEILGTERVVGCSASAMMTERGEINRPPAVTVLIGDDRYCAIHPFVHGRLKKHNAKIAKEILAKRPGQAGTLVLFPDIFHLNSEEFFQQFNEYNENQINPLRVVGGAPSSENPACRTFQFSGTEILQGGISGFYIESDEDSQIGIAQACHPVSTVHEVTACEGQWILEIDHQPAFQVLQNDLPEPLWSDTRAISQRVFLALSYQNERDIISGDYLIRNIVGVDLKHHIITCAGRIEKGMKIAFSVLKADGSREHLKKMLSNMQSHLGNRPIQLGMYFNCCARGPSLYGMDDIDSSYITRSFPNIPMIGFSSFGEIGPIAGQHFLQTYTGILALV